MYMTLQNIEIRHLAALRAVAEEGSFGRAADRLGFSQSAVSQQIAGLERAVGEPVFDRLGGPRKAEMTPAGRLVLKHAESILARLDLAGQELDKLRAGTSGRLVIGTFQSISVKLLPSVLSLVRKETPELDIRLVESDDNEELIQRLADDELDLSFLIGPLDDDRIEAIEICRDPFVVVLPGDVETRSDHDYPLSELEGRAMIGAQASSCQELIDDELRSAGITPEYVFRSNDNGAIQAMVRAGMGPSIMALLAVETDDPRVKIRHLDPPLTPRTIFVGWRRGRTRPPAVDRFVELTVSTTRNRAAHS